MALKKNKKYPAFIAALLIAMIILVALLVFLWFSGSYLIKADKKNALSLELSVTDINEGKVIKSYSPEEESLIKYQSISHKDKEIDEIITCSDDSDCDDSDLFTLDTCALPGTADSFCTNEEIICLADSDCGTDGFIGSVFCNLDDVWQNYKTFTCESSGTASYCSQTTTPMLITACSDTCADGACISVTCDDDSDCDDSNTYTLDTCVLPGTAGSYCTNENQQAVLTLIFSNLVYEIKNNIVINGITYPKVNYYYHKRTFTEYNNVGVTLTFGQLCYASLGTCDSATVNYRIDANDVLIRDAQNFWTTQNSETFTLTYWGVDDNGYDIVISQNICVNGASFTPGC